MPFLPTFTTLGNFRLTGGGGKIGLVGGLVKGDLGGSTASTGDCIASWHSWIVTPPSFGILLFD